MKQKQAAQQTISILSTNQFFYHLPREYSLQEKWEDKQS
jgi:hypothetical protein